MPIHLRLLGLILPSIGGLDHRIIGKLHRKTGFSTTPIVCANGFQMVGTTSNAGYVSGVSERDYMDAIASVIQDGDIVFNIGANVGYTALWLSQHFRKRGKMIEVVAFEPDEDNFHILQENIALNPGFSVQAARMALGDIDGMIGFSSQGAGDGSAHIEPESPRRVLIHQLDTYMACCRAAPAWLIIDVEGYSGECLAGGERLLANNRPRVAIEIHSEKERQSCQSILRRLNYRRARALKSLWGEFEIWYPEGG